jgi:hypothetical protein
MLDPQSQVFAGMVRAVVAQLDLGDDGHPWRIVRPLVPATEDNIGVHVEGVATVYVPVAATSTTDEVAAGLADQLQGHVIDIMRRAVPECPLAGHQHPAKAALVDGHAAWVCPQTGDRVRSIMPDQTA